MHACRWEGWQGQEQVQTGGVAMSHPHRGGSVNHPHGPFVHMSLSLCA